ncbi:arylsulfatase [Pedobacter sp. BS3]|uniref:arylsulfatase n=1 Tax=Pedobacter sp. BS3 TaxID=2567937 RepID=UPI0011EEA4F2|nr:arylsulfatase [Pedobacter sp. BS3]TZF82620.1 arylsulfatase [Pedobacter sp. BS3]
MNKYKTAVFFTAILSAGLLVSWRYGSVKAKIQTPSYKQPNVILILSDDMGYSDIGCYGGEAATHNLDQLASEGLRYTQFYNTSRCCPSRASLLTGLYPHQAGMGWMTTRDFHLPGYRGDLSHNAVTIAEALKNVGYATYMTGKWHVNFHPTPTSSKENWPLQRGFDHYYGTILGAANYYDPGYLCRDNQLITPYTDSLYKPREYYFTDAISDNSVNYIRERDKNKPFFMYVAYTAAHWPMQAPENVIKKYKGRFDRGYETLRAERLERMKKLGVIDQPVELSPFDGKPWNDEENKPAMLRRMETYAAMIDVMDQGIGRIIKQLKTDGIYENTLIIFLQDNGACAEILGGGKTVPVAKNPANVRKLSPETLIYSNNPPVTRDGKLVMQGKNVMAGPPDTYVSYMKEWANVSNTPLRKFKHYVHEGGIATPLIIHWPQVIKQAGAIRTQVGHEMDIMPTILDAAQVSYPKMYNNNTITPCEGISLVPTFTGKPLNRTALFWEHEMNRAVRMGKWKLVSEADLKKQFFKSHPWELYDLSVDRSEMHNLASSHPELVKQMSAMWEDYAKRCQVYPMPWKAEDGKF